MRGVAENKQGLLIDGSRVRVRVPVSEPYAAVLVPDTAILSDQDKRYVLVVNDKNVVSRRDVALGKLLDDGMRVILAEADGKVAIGAEEWIVVQGLQRADQLPGGSDQAVGRIRDRKCRVSWCAVCPALTCLSPLENQEA